MRSFFLAVLAVVLLAPDLASAQINPFGGAQGMTLSNDDFATMSHAVERLLARPKLHVGSSESWKNPHTGSTGTISVQNYFSRKSLVCHTLGYQVAPRGKPASGMAVLDWCKTLQGWRIV